jgi:nitrogen fixation/metabolism regulation signal transduction histidine kinase
MFRIRHIATRFALLLGLAAVVPLIAYGAISILSLQRGTRESIIGGNQNVATRAAEEIRRYVTTNAEILKALAADLQNTGLTDQQKDQILKNYVVEFREFREVTLFAEDGTAGRDQPRRQATRRHSTQCRRQDRQRRDVADPG